MSYFFRRLFHFEKFDEAQVVRGKTTPESNSGSFAPKGGRAAGDKGTPGPGQQGGYTMLAPVVHEALVNVRDTIKRWATKAIGKLKQPGVVDKATLLHHATISKPLYDTLMKGVAAAMGGDLLMGNNSVMQLAQEIEGGRQIERPVVMVADIKGGPRLDEKAKLDYGGDWSMMKDMVRGTILVPKADKLDDALEALERAGIKIATEPKDRVNNPGPEGYRDLKLNVELDNGHIAEVQVMTPEIFVAKMLKAHHLYAEIRPLISTLEAEKREPTPEEWKLIERNNYRQKVELYDPAWAKDLQV